jgi:hypothetical protein
MTDSEIAARLTEALVASAGDGAELVSAEITIVARREISGEVRVSTDRKTKSLLFLSAQAHDASGARVAMATSVHKLS